MALLDESIWLGKVYRGGWQPGGAGTRSVVAPATGATIGHVGEASPADVPVAAGIAAGTATAWAARPYPERAAVLRRAGALCEEYAGEIGDWLVREGGAVPGKAAFEMHLVAGECYEAAGLPGLPYGELLRSEEPRLSFSARVPVGVVGVISPYNFPLILAMRSVAPALALGNAVILKPDPRTAVSGGVAVARIFEEAGLPDGLLHVLPGGVDVGEALVTEPRVPVISFTGSTAAGRRVGQLAADRLKRVHLELGGNSALVVLDDADLDRAVSAGAWGSFLHQGQICMTTGRHLVQSAVYDRYVEMLAGTADGLPVGDPAGGEVALGPLIDERARDRVHGLVTGSVSAGARLAAGGSYDGLFYRPTVLGDVGTGMPAYVEEVFGPVAPVLRFDTLEEAATLAADNPYGLSLGILTGDVMRGMALAEQIPSGLVHINDQTVNDEATAPFGGLGVSGTGARFGGPAANIEAFTDTRWVTVRRQIPTYPM